MNKEIMVDIDSTLWPMYPVMVKKIAESKKILEEEIRFKWINWDEWKQFVTLQEFNQIVDNIHHNQHAYNPYYDASDFLKLLKQLRFKIIIASHRKESTRASTRLFLDNNNLVYDELHLSFDKTVLFDKVSYVIDDCPQILESAVSKNISVSGLRYHYNKYLNIPLRNSLKEVGNYIQGRELLERRGV